MSKKFSLPDGDAVVFRLSAMGDVALMTGVLLYWHKLFGIRFIVVTREAFAPLFYQNPAVSGIEFFTGEDLKSLSVFRKKSREIAERHADKFLIDLHASNRSRIFSQIWQRMTGRPVLRYDKMPFARRLFLLSHGCLFRSRLLRCNVTERYARTLSPTLPIPDNCEVAGELSIRALLRPRIFLSTEEFLQAEKQLRRLFPDFILPKKEQTLRDKDTDEQPRQPLIALHPFATHSAKTWEPEKWQLLAEMLQRKGCHTVWVGLGNDMSGSSLINKTSLRELCGVLACCDALVSGDSGPMHLASATDTPLVALFGPTCEEWGFFPQGNVKILQLDMPCRPCSLHGGKGCARQQACLANLQPEDVVRALEGISI